MESDFATGGRQIQATAMFVDVIGSTGLAQRTDPDRVVEILNGFFETVVRCVGAEGGFVNKFQGDGALCIFGAPVEQSDHAARALRAARALAADLSSMGDIAAAIGVSSGLVVAGNVGAVDRYEFTVIGDPVNEAARLSDEAKHHPSHVLVSERTVLAAGAEALGWIAGDTLPLRGRAEPTRTFTPGSD
jgi:adenylate cyclase